MAKSEIQAGGPGRVYRKVCVIFQLKSILNMENIDIYSDLSQVGEEDEVKEIMSNIGRYSWLRVPSDPLLLTPCLHFA